MYAVSKIGGRPHVKVAHGVHALLSTSIVFMLAEGAAITLSHIFLAVIR